jgi:hypothetical protein
LSYIKNCKECGQRISLREMQRGQWVAFDVNTDVPHKHNKRKKAQRKSKQDHKNFFEIEKNNYETSEESKKKNINIWPYIIIGIIILVIIYN